MPQVPIKGWLVALLAASVLLSPIASRAQGDTADELARRHFESGAAYLEESDYENALRAFQKAYELSKRPEILLNIATVQERRGDIAGALSALRDYLAVAPEGEPVDTVQLRIQNLEKRQPNDPPPAAPPAQPATPPEPPAVSAPPPASAPPAPAAPSTRPGRTPIFVAFGIGAVAAGGAVITGVLAQNKYDDLKSSCSPNCSDSALSPARGLALSSTLLTGAAVIGVGVGVTLLVLEKPSEPQARGPRLQLALTPTPGGAAAHAFWRF